MNIALYLRKFIFILICGQSFSLFARVFFSPGIDDWLWYASTFEYPLEFYFYNKRSNFCWDIGVDYRSRFADTVAVCNSLELGKNLAVIFHGSEDFLLADLQPTPDDIYSAQNSEYAFVPDYFLNETTTKINLQVSKDFLYQDNTYIHSTLRCIIPFSTQSIVNIASGNMLYNTNTNAIRHKSYRDSDEYKENKSKDLMRRKKKKESKVLLSSKKNRDFKKDVRSIVSPYVQLKEESGNSCFAVQGKYFSQSDQSLFNYISDSINFPFIVYNKNAPSVSAFDAHNINLSIDKLSHSYGIASDETGSNAYYHQFVSYDGQQVYDKDNKGYIVQNTPYQSGLNPSSCIVSFYTYGNGVNDINNQFFVEDNYGVSYSITTMPDYIYDVSVGDIVSTAPVLVGNGIDGTILSNLVSQNNLLRVVATANYGQNSSLDPMWSQDYVNFSVPPLVVQNSSSGFPAVFGQSVVVPNLKHFYNTTSTNGVQFDSYGDSLKNNLNNINPRVTILNEDGSFYDSDADYALLWYQKNYTNLFNSASDALNNLYLTTAIDSSTNAPSSVSDLISKKIGSSPDPTPCCEKVVEWVEDCIYKPIVTTMNANFMDLQEQIWSLTSIQNTIVGNVSPIVDAPQREASSEPCNYEGDNLNVFRKLDDQSVQESDSKDLTRSLVNSCISFNNGVFGSMNYNGFHRAGMGDVLLEFICGSYFYAHKALLDFYLALECPTAEGINQSESYLAVGLGNNGHYVGRVGLQGSVDIEYAYRLRLSSRLYFEHGFDALEKIAPSLEGYPIFNFLPVKMDTIVSWNGGLFYLDGSLYTNDYSGFTLSYQYWKKAQDSILMTNPFLLTIPNVEVDESEAQLMPSLDSVLFYSGKCSHTCGITFFSRITNETFLNAGCSRVFAGNNIPKALDFYCSLGISY